MTGFVDRYSGAGKSFGVDAIRVMNAVAKTDKHYDEVCYTQILKSVIILT